MNQPNDNKEEVLGIQDQLMLDALDKPLEVNEEVVKNVLKRLEESENNNKKR